MPEYKRLRELLAEETFPHTYCFKFVGKQSPAFEAGARSLELMFSSLVLKSSRQSTNQKHLSLTYTLEAESVEEIISVLKVIAQIPDVQIIL